MFTFVFEAVHADFIVILAMLNTRSKFVSMISCIKDIILTNMADYSFVFIEYLRYLV